MDRVVRDLSKHSLAPGMMKLLRCWQAVVGEEGEHFEGWRVLIVVLLITAATAECDQNFEVTLVALIADDV